jgi:hypothetical protein
MAAAAVGVRRRRRRGDKGPPPGLEEGGSGGGGEEGAGGALGRAPPPRLSVDMVYGPGGGTAAAMARPNKMEAESTSAVCAPRRGGSAAVSAEVGFMRMQDD